MTNINNYRPVFDEFFFRYYDTQPKLDFQSDANHLPLATSSLELALTSHLSEPKILEEIGRVLKPGGLLIAQTSRYSGSVYTEQAGLRLVQRSTFADPETDKPLYNLVFQKPDK